MPGQSGCFVPYCDTGRKGCTEKRTMFSVPKDIEMLKKWKEVVPTAHRELGLNDKICHVHFTEEDIRKGLKVLVAGKEEIFPMLWRLNPTAVPSIFPTKSLEPNLIPEGHRSKRIRKGPRMATHTPAKNARASESAEGSAEDTTETFNGNQNSIAEDLEFSPKTNDSSISCRLTLANGEQPSTHSINPSSENITRESTMEPPLSNTTPGMSSNDRESLVDPQHAKLPPSWNWHVINHPRKRLLCLLPSLSLGEAIIIKAIEIATKNSVIYYIFGKRFDCVDLEYHFQSLNEFQEILNNFDKARTCCGCTDSAFRDIKFCASGRFQGGVWRSNKCKLLDESICYECVKLRNVLEPRTRRTTKAKHPDAQM